MNNKNNFCQEWDVAYQNETHQSKWPWASLISLVYQYINLSEKNLEILELGCGYGANIPFFDSLDINYFAVDGSEYVVNDLKKRFPHLSQNIKAADFSRELPFGQKFDCIFDRSAVGCNDTKAIENTIKLIENHLKDGGLYIGVDWFSSEHSEYLNDKGIVVDSFTKENFPDGPFHKVGKVHFSTQEHIERLFKNFSFLRLDHKKTLTIIPQDTLNSTVWDFVLKYNK